VPGLGLKCARRFRYPRSRGFQDLGRSSDAMMQHFVAVIADFVLHPGYGYPLAIGEIRV
jgi:hypothetical protein